MFYSQNLILNSSREKEETENIELFKFFLKIFGEETYFYMELIYEPNTAKTINFIEKFILGIRRQSIQRLKHMPKS